jgi:monothiol glutaredoxin
MLTDTLKARFEAETKSNPIVIYMKGNLLFPACGFSAHAVQLLQPHGKIHAIDVMAEPEVREGIKAFTNWPTIPQIFINGKFVGGRDIVAELAERGELESLIKGS